MSLALAACKGAAQPLRLSGSTMGTTYNVIALDAEGQVREADLQVSLDARLAEIDMQMSNWNPNSEISRFNALRTTDPFPVSDGLLSVMRAAQDVHETSDGQFDVTLGPLIELWGFGAKEKTTPIPSEAAIQSALHRVDQNRVIISADGALRKTHPDTSVYLAAIGKGYGVDQIAQVLKEAGLSDYMVEIGGDLYASGKNADGTPWQVGIETPVSHTRALETVVSVSGLGMATSGDYRNYFEENGQRYSHILDAHTGRPVTHTTASVTVLAESAMLADAWATAMLVLGYERGLEIAEAENLAVLFITRDSGTSDLTFTHHASARFTALQP